MQYIKELWDSGVIDPELMLNDSTKKEEKFYQGKSGSMLAPLFRHVSRHESLSLIHISFRPYGRR